MMMDSNKTSGWQDRHLAEVAHLLHLFLPPLDDIMTKNSNKTSCWSALATMVHHLPLLPTPLLNMARKGGNKTSRWQALVVVLHH